MTAAAHDLGPFADIGTFEGFRQDVLRMAARGPFAVVAVRGAEADLLPLAEALTGLRELAGVYWLGGAELGLVLPRCDGATALEAVEGALAGAALADRASLGVAEGGPGTAPDATLRGVLEALRVAELRSETAVVLATDLR